MPRILPKKKELFNATYGRAGGIYHTFPPATSGFFYYHSPPPGAPDIAGDIRFRVTNDRDPSSFTGGTDLMIHGLPWLIPLVPNSEVSHRFLPSLRRDSLLTNDQVRRIERFSTERPIYRREQPIYAFGQPCRLQISGRQSMEREAVIEKEYLMFGIVDGEDRLERALLHKVPLTEWGYEQPGQPPRVFSAPGTLPYSRDLPCSP